MAASRQFDVFRAFDLVGDGFVEILRRDAGILQNPRTFASGRHRQRQKQVRTCVLVNAQWIVDRPGDQPIDARAKGRAVGRDPWPGSR